MEVDRVKKEDLTHVTFTLTRNDLEEAFRTRKNFLLLLHKIVADTYDEELAEELFPLDEGDNE